MLNFGVYPRQKPHLSVPIQLNGFVVTSLHQQGGPMAPKEGKKRWKFVAYLYSLGRRTAYKERLKVLLKMGRGRGREGKSRAANRLGIYKYDVFPRLPLFPLFGLRKEWGTGSAGAWKGESEEARPANQLPACQACLCNVEMGG